ncbi:hypothetical protein CISIN_1g044121mg [Citrus sinensis]|uniref:Secreted protein n=1 Tax=Citrus sinensis TaxID=2711 RepID=A0A067EHG6_CITSI|nr:hypothetical protein CISIN_1g044121mg [Citrus sinensis]
MKFLHGCASLLGIHLLQIFQIKSTASRSRHKHVFPLIALPRSHSFILRANLIWKCRVLITWKGITAGRYLLHCRLIHLDRRILTWINPCARDRDTIKRLILLWDKTHHPHLALIRWKHKSTRGALHNRRGTMLLPICVGCH